MRKLPDKPVETRKTKFLEWWRNIVYAGDKLVALLILLILVVGTVVVIVCDIATTVTTTESAQVIAIGTRGITVQYCGRYGKGLEATIDTNNQDQFAIGETVTIQVTDSRVRPDPKVSLVAEKV